MSEGIGGPTVLRDAAQHVDDGSTASPSGPSGASADYPAPCRFTHAIWARELGRLARLATQAVTRETDGMWNPAFCNSDARPWAVSVIADARAILDWCELRIIRHVEDGGASRPPSGVNAATGAQATEGTNP